MAFATETASRWIVNKEIVLRFMLMLMIGAGSVSFIEPSPYEIFFLILVPFVVFGHFAITRVTLALVFLAVLFLIGEGMSLIPHFGSRPIVLNDGSSGSSTVYYLETTYLFVSAVIFAIIFSRHTAARLKVALAAYAFSSLFAACWAIAAYLQIPGFYDGSAIIGRVAGPFKDPNVLGAYCVLGALYFMQQTIIGPKRLRIPLFLALAITLFGGIFLPLSRGAWGAMTFGTIYLGAVTYVTADNKAMRARIAASAMSLALMGVAGTVYVAMNPALSSIVTDRAKLEQDYDSGTTGRFGNQLRSIPMLIERPLGFGPHRFSIYFDLDPHNSYIGAFSSAGWLGGTIFFLFAALTSILAVRLTIRRTPYLRHAQTVAPALLSAFLQAFQIDVDHWRFVYLMAGAIWGMQAALQKDEIRESRRNDRQNRDFKPPAGYQPRPL